MGRLLERRSNAAPRLMIVSTLQPVEQNPAYRFAAEKKFPFLQNRRGLFFVVMECVIFYTFYY
jgi:hypothetical protein